MADIETSDLAGYAHPTAVPIADRTGWLRRRWVLRTSRDIDVATCSVLGEAITKVVLEALLESGVSTDVLNRGAPVVSVAALDEQHVVVQTDFVGPGSGLNLGDAAALANWAALRQVDARLHVEELEGLPRRYWWFLTAGTPK